MKVVKFREDVKLPTKSHELDCGLDLFIPDNLTIRPFETVCIGLGLGFYIPEGFAGIFNPRSSIAKKGIIIHPAIIDPGYTGEVHLIATNCSGETYKFEKDSRLCSIVCYSILNSTINPEDNRGSNGLGSTGK